MEQLPTINLRKGATAAVRVNLTNFDMQGGHVTLTISDRRGNPKWEFEMDEARVWNVVIPDEFTATLKVGEDDYLYDIMCHVANERFAQCEPSPITVHLTAGGYQHVAGN